MRERKLPQSPADRPVAGWPIVVRAWYGLVALGGLGFGLVAERQPFGDDIFVHPLIMFFALIALSLLAVRTMFARPVPELIPDRSLMLGCVLGLAMFLVGNFAAAHLLRHPY